MEMLEEGTAHDLAERLKDLRGVRGVKVASAGPGEPVVRVLVVPERSTQETVADVLARASSLGIELDADHVEVVRSGPEIPRGRSHRRRITSLTVTRTAATLSARVALELAGDVLIGEAMIPTGSRSELKAVAHATVDAARRILPFGVEVGSVDTLVAAGFEIVVVALERGAGVLVGSAPVRADRFDAVARATLAAVNRFIEAPAGVA